MSDRTGEGATASSTRLSRARRGARRRRRTPASWRRIRIEQLARLGQVAAAFAEIGERVPDPEVVLRDRCTLPPRVEHRDRVARGGRGRRASPRARCGLRSRARPTATPRRAPPTATSTRAYLPLRAGAVHQHRMLLDRAGQVGERLELLAPRPGTARAGSAQAEQLAHRGGVGIRVAQRAQDARRVALVAGVERLGRARRAPAPRVRAPRPATRRELLAWPRSSGAGRAAAVRRPCGPRGRALAARSRSAGAAAGPCATTDARLGRGRGVGVSSRAGSVGLGYWIAAARRVAIVGVPRRALVRARAPAASAAGRAPPARSRLVRGPCAARAGRPAPACGGPDRACRAPRGGRRPRPAPRTAAGRCGCTPARLRRAATVRGRSGSGRLAPRAGAAATPPIAARDGRSRSPHATRSAPALGSPQAGAARRDHRLAPPDSSPGRAPRAVGRPTRARARAGAAARRGRPPGGRGGLSRARRGARGAADLSTARIAVRWGDVTLRVNAKTPASKGGRHLRKNPAATYSPRGSTPKYHRRGRA